MRNVSELGQEGGCHVLRVWALVGQYVGPCQRTHRTCPHPGVRSLPAFVAVSIVWIVVHVAEQSLTLPVGGVFQWPPSLLL